MTTQMLLYKTQKPAYYFYLITYETQPDSHYV